MIEVYDQNQNEIGILDNAYHVNIERRANEIYSASFSLPQNDPKNDLCTHFNYIDIYGDSGRYYGKYRIMPTETKKSESEESITYKCEHVISTLWDDIMDDEYVEFKNQPTRTVIEGILSFQEDAHWQLGQCDFERYFDYGYENEDGLVNALFDVPTRFDEPYQFTYETTTYPWTVNLIKADTTPKAQVRWGKNIKSFEDISDPRDIVNILIPKGWGEGVNQLTIKDVNGGSKSIQDQDSINKWGKIKRRLIDRRFKDPASLKAYAEKVLQEVKDPSISFKCEFVDLSILPEYEHEQINLFDVVEIRPDNETVFYARVTGDEIDPHNEHDRKFDIGNRIHDVVDSQADLERDMNVQKGYTNGSANYLSANETENADPTHPVKFRIWIPQDVVHFNFMELTYESSPFRAYVRGTKSAGQIIKTETTSSGGGQTTSAGGGQTTSAGGGQTSAANGDHYHRDLVRASSLDSQSATERGYYAYMPNAGAAIPIKILVVDGQPADDIHTYDSSGDHTHTVSNHTHTVSNHTHSVSDHTHKLNLNIDGHTHDQEFGIYEHNSMPTKLEIKVDGTVIPETSLSQDSVDLVPYLQKDSNGRISRGRWADVELRPTDELVRINATVVWGLFISSLKGTAL